MEQVNNPSPLAELRAANRAVRVIWWSRAGNRPEVCHRAVPLEIVWNPEVGSNPNHWLLRFWDLDMKLERTAPLPELLKVEDYV